jgi:acyl dehydratase
MSPSRAPAGPTAVPIETRGLPADGPTRLGRDEVKVGTAGEPWTAPPLTVTDIVRYQGASGDLNPIHHDEAFARAAGYPTVFAVGMLQAGVLGTYLTEWLGPRGVRRLRVQFREQAWAGDEITYSGVVVGIRRDTGDEVLVDVELTAVRQTGGVHLRGWATIAM